MRAIKFKNKRLFYLDQTKLPLGEVWKECQGLNSGYKAIKELQVRGAPLIGVFAAYCLYLHLKNKSLDKKSFLTELEKASKQLKSCRPTAVNLAWALQRLEAAVIRNKGKTVAEIKKAILKEAQLIHEEDIRLCQKIGEYGVKLISEGDSILTHCNAGLLATAGEGTALSVIYKANKVYKNIKVYAGETRPLLQGARLTAWELSKNKVPVKVICDNMAASLMQRGKIDKIIVGADRIAANGDTANKIGTYGLAVLARYHKIPFYIAAPFSTFDLSLENGNFIPIEERKKDEVRKIANKIYITPFEADVYNPAFDVTPANLITAIVSDKGIIHPPFTKNIKKTISQSRTHPT